MKRHVFNALQAPTSGRRQFLRLAAASAGFALVGSALTACGGGGSGGLATAGPSAESTFSLGDPGAPWVECVAGSATAGTMEVKVHANQTDLSSGFILQWISLDAFSADGDSWEKACHAVFDARQSGSQFGLAPGESLQLTVGASLKDVATELSCNDPLPCETKFVLRVLTLGTDLTQVDDALVTITYCWTGSCAPKGCTYTIGYWQTHGPIPRGNNRNEWPLTSVVLGNTEYTDLQALAILQSSPRGNGLIILARQVIGAKLNVAAGAGTDAILALLAQADNLIGDLVIGQDSLPSSTTSSLASQLDAYNNGLSGVAHCG